MIECTENYIFYKKRKKKHFKRFFCLFLILTIVVSLYLYYNKVVCKQIFTICANYSYSVSAEAVNSAVLISLNNSLEYSDLVLVEKNSAGDIVYMSTNSLKVNKINRNIASATAILIKEKMHKGVEIPFLAFTGVSFLSGYGKNVCVKVVNNVSVICTFSSKFTSVGINQTLHSVYVDVISRINLSVPFNNHKVECKTSVLISETVLVGKVPDIYLKEGVFS